MMTGRTLALLVLVLQLQPAVLPVLCDGARAPNSADCDWGMSPSNDGSAVTVPRDHVPCVNPALCGIAPTATPGWGIDSVSVTESREAADLLRPGAHAIDAPAPLPPPPEA